MNSTTEKYRQVQEGQVGALAVPPSQERLFNTSDYDRNLRIGKAAAAT